MRHCHATGALWMLELGVTAFAGHFDPAVGFQGRYHLSALHVVCTDTHSPWVTSIAAIGQTTSSDLPVLDLAMSLEVRTHRDEPPADADDDDGALADPLATRDCAAPRGCSPFPWRPAGPRPWPTPGDSGPATPIDRLSQ